MSEDEFCSRFVAAMVAAVGPRFDDGDFVEDYARETAPSYFEDDFGMSPEECALTDISYWGD